jgi:hypothetical protein
MPPINVFRHVVGIGIPPDKLRTPLTAAAVILADNVCVKPCLAPEIRVCLDMVSYKIVMLSKIKTATAA